MKADRFSGSGIERREHQFVEERKLGGGRGNADGSGSQTRCGTAVTVGSLEVLDVVPGGGLPVIYRAWRRNPGR
jgi:hypothetical protein